MTLIRGLNQLASARRPCVASIGNYDGVHLGHQHVIETLLAKGQQLGLPATIITFDPLAKEFFAPEHTTRIASVAERIALLTELGVAQVLLIEFNREFSEYSPEGFVADVLLKGLGVKYLAVGDDFRFGNQRSGDFTLLQSMGAEHGFDVVAHDTFEYQGERVSSGRVRTALADSSFELAARLLGREFAITGEVSLGQQIGRTLNYPTANIVLPSYRLPLSGVFAVRVRLENGELHQGVANLGTRPTVDGKENRLEVHIFNFSGDIYGQQLSVTPLHKIRDEEKFDSLPELKAQIKKDANVARAFFKSAA